ncbi:MAG: Ribosomal protein L11 methyltransferase [uncultured Chloroflexi bacterium]|uniref:Ribosomal protein L11 methyltransferase n=1 Tax=uncultured Chloroflexota bacterium TaxID=166587 RepID=A0A6J4J8Q2_9CHLR|nr:MAG: Ribosomal protein L11 methyltransferase [uncultured Chloroflexota bacterium]
MTSTPPKWLEISIRASAEAAEALTPVFEKAGRSGVVIEPELLPQKDETDELTPVPGAFALLKTYLTQGAEADAGRKIIEDAVGLLRAFNLAPMDELRTRWLEQEDWANAWKQHYSVLRLGRRWVIKPQWQSYDLQPNDRLIELDPGMAFGTGQHPTTQLVLEVLEDLVDAGEVAGRALLDLGCGSGVLAIGAVRAGARSVLALDADEIAARATTENVARNGFSDAITVEHGTLGAAIDGVVPVPGLDHESAYDGAFANIVARIIAERAPALARALRPGAWLIASGIIAEREAEAADALVAAGFTIERREQRSDWLALLCRRDPISVQV